MKKLMMTAAALALMAAGAGKAMAADQAININATVTSFCSIGGNTGSLTAVNANLSTSNGNVSTAPVSVPIGAVVCNGAANVTLSSANGAAYGPAGPVPSGFQNRINYGASTTGVPVTVTVNASDADGVAGPAITAGPTAQGPAFTASTVTVDITPVANPLPLLAGSYSDVLTLTIAPI